MYTKVVIGFIIVGLGTDWAGAQTRDAAAQGRVTLMGTLAEWMYPGSKLRGRQYERRG